MTKPDLRNHVRGDQHWAHTHPEWRPWGERNGKHTRSEQIQRGDEHWSHVHPEDVTHGEGHGMAKLTEEQVAEIRRLYATGQYTQRKLGFMYGVAQCHISAITRGHLWRHSFHESEQEG